jgi:uncharacterized protein (TIGR02646 family)
VLFRRVENPPPQKKYQDYKPYLRRDFRTRCAYCLVHEAHYGGLRNYHVDHFRPKKLFPKLTLEYGNLYYACGLCNTFKGDVWPSQEQQNAGFGFTDPCQEDPYETHFLVNEQDGSLRALTNAGRYTLEHLRLDRRQLRKYRRMQIEAKEKCEELRSLLGAPGLNPEWVRQVKDALDQIERDALDPLPSYDVADLS